MDTIKSFKRCGVKGLYRQMSCRGITGQSAVLYRLLTQTIEAPKKRTVKNDKQKEKVEKDDSEKKKLQFLYVVQAQYEHRTSADTHLQYHCA